MSSSSSSLISQRMKYDVFLSFRGEDTRYNFTSHIYHALSKSEIDTFIDDELERGDQISPAILTAIKRSKISVIVFSKDYASSRWCLEELVKILECKNVYGQTVIPVFYHVNPSDIRKQTGTYGDSFTELAKKETLEKLQKWRNALAEAANLSGWDSGVIRSEASLIKEIVKDIVKRLKRAFSPDNNNLIGIHSKVNIIASMLHLRGRRACGHVENSDARVVGIWGIGGIGKTTLAETVYNEISSEFEGSHFVRNIREESGNVGGLARLQQQLLAAILEEEHEKLTTFDTGLTFTQRRLCKKKILVIFDDVTDSLQVESLIGEFGLYNDESRFIITTRDKQVLQNHCVEKNIYELNGLFYSESHQLFCRYAFKEKDPAEDYTELSKKVVEYARGVPLALKVLGSFVCGKSEREWESAMKKLEKVPHGRIHDMLEISYMGLDDDQKNIFLDVACFFKGEDVDFVINLLNAYGYSTVIELSVLTDKCLISYFNGKITMHDLVQATGREIVRRESSEDPGSRSRLWYHEDIRQVLTQKVGTKAIKGILWDMSKINETMLLKENAFKKMKNLRFLKFYYSEKSTISRLQVSQSLGCSSIEVRYLHWERCPLISLQSNFHPENLLGLDLRFSHVERLWDDVQPLVNLKDINLSWSQKLTTIPDLSSAQNLERLVLTGCTKLIEVSSSIRYLNKLIVLDLKGCSSLFGLPECRHLSSLVYLNISDCSRLEAIPDIPCNVKELYVYGTAIEGLPSSVGYISRLENLELDLHGCLKLKCLPSSICKLKFLKRLDISDCKEFDRLPDEFGDLKALKFLQAPRTAIEELPSSIIHLYQLELLDLYGCSKLKSLPNGICDMHSLARVIVSRGKKVDNLPHNVRKSRVLVELYASQRETNPSTGFALPPLFDLDKLKTLILRDCCITELPNTLRPLPSLEELDLSCNDFDSLPTSIKHLAGLKILRLSYCDKLQSLPELPRNLHVIEADYCLSLKILSPSSILLASRMHQNTKVTLVGCFKLDQTALRSVMEDAYSRIKLKAPMLRTDVTISGKLTDAGEVSSICYPGCKTPDWFDFRNAGCSATLELPLDWFNSKSSTFSLCAVVDLTNIFNKQDSVAICFRCKFKFTGGLSFAVQGFMSAWINVRPYIVGEYHVVVGYFNAFVSGLYFRLLLLRKFQHGEVLTEFWLADSRGERIEGYAVDESAIQFTNSMTRNLRHWKWNETVN